jgi:DNA segregation ATPase FtsK/SpoIIIE-like protein
MRTREAEMRDRGLQNWPGKRVFLIIDEYAEIQSEIDSAMTKDEKAVARRVAVDLVRIGRRARALGIVVVCALQKATTDAMDSALRANLNCRICLRVNSRQFASSVLDGLDELPADPVALPPGQFIYYDAARGELEHAVAQIAPGVTLADTS